MFKTITLEEFVAEYKKQENHYKKDDLPEITFDFATKDYYCLLPSTKKFGAKEIHIKNMDQYEALDPYSSFHDWDLVDFTFDIYEKEDLTLHFKSRETRATMIVTDVREAHITLKYPFWKYDDMTFTLSYTWLKDNKLSIGALSGDEWEITLDENSTCKIIPHVLAEEHGS